MVDQRLEQLKQWLFDLMPRYTDFDPQHCQVVPVSGDASFRRYFRLVSGGESWIAVDAPPAQEDSQPFIAVAKTLAQRGVCVPKVFDFDLGLGFMLLQDLGDELYLAHLNEQSVDKLYKEAMSELLLIQQCQDLQQGSLPVYDHALLTREVGLFRDWFLVQLLQLELDESDGAQIDYLFKCLIDCALEQPRIFVHRDFHSRNIMYRPSMRPGIIDFQDAVRGPITYDLVSLLRDCYIAWPDHRVYQWLEDYRLQLQSADIAVPETDLFQYWFDLMGAQRHLKAIGIFSRLLIRDAKPRYLADIPRTLAYLLNVAQKYPELESSAYWLKTRVLPAMYSSEHFTQAQLDQWLSP